MTIPFVIFIIVLIVSVPSMIAAYRLMSDHDEEHAAWAALAIGLVSAVCLVATMAVGLTNYSNNETRQCRIKVAQISERTSDEIRRICS